MNFYQQYRLNTLKFNKMIYKFKIINGYWTMDGKKYIDLDDEKREVFNMFFHSIKNRK